MKARRVLWLPILALACIGLVGCTVWDKLFYKAEAVGPAELASFTGSPPTTETATMQSVATPVLYTALFGVQAVMSDEAFQSLGVLATRYSPGLRLLSRLARPMATPRTVTYTNNSDANTVDIKVSVTDETYDAADYGGTTGTLSVPLLDATVFAEVDNADTPTHGEAKGEAEAKITVDALDVGYGEPDGFIVNEGILNLKTKGNGKADFTSDGTPSSVTYSLSLDLKSGFSVSFDGDVGAKFIVEFNYVDKGSYTQEQLQEYIDTGDYSTLAEGLDVLLKIEVYDNANALVNSYSYDENDLIALVQQQM